MVHVEPVVEPRDRLAGGRIPVAAGQVAPQNPESGTLAFEPFSSIFGLH